MARRSPGTALPSECTVPHSGNRESLRVHRAALWNHRDPQSALWNPRVVLDRLCVRGISSQKGRFGLGCLPGGGSWCHGLVQKLVFGHKLNFIISEVFSNLTDFVVP